MNYTKYLSVFAILGALGGCGESLDGDEWIEEDESAAATTLGNVTFNSALNWGPFKPVVLDKVTSVRATGAGVYAGAGSAKWTATAGCAVAAYSTSIVSSDDYLLAKGHQLKLIMFVKTPGASNAAKMVANIGVNGGATNYTKEVAAGSSPAWKKITITTAKNTSNTPQRAFVSISAFNPCSGPAAPFEFWLDNIKVQDVVL